MIFDQQNIFFDAASTITNSDVVANVGGGDAADPLFLVAVLNAAQAGDITFTLKTSDAEGMTSAATMCTLVVPAGKTYAAVKVPYGAKKFLRVSGSGTLSGKATVGLTETVPNWHA